MSYTPPPGGAGTGAPNDAGYVVVASDGDLSAEVLLSAVHGYGNTASRPAAGMLGRLYYDTDVDKMYRDNGGTWDEVEGASAPHNILSASHSDVDTGATPNDADVLTWDDGAGEWVPAPAPGAGTGAATTLSYVTTASEASLSNESVLGSAVMPTAAYASLPAAGLSGRVGFPTDGFTLLRDNGSDYQPWGPIYGPFTPPVDGDYSWLTTQGSATVTAAKGGIFIDTPLQALAANQIRVRGKTAPSTPYTITVAFLPLIIAVGGSAGICWRQSSDGKLIIFQIQARTYNSTDEESGWALALYKMSSPTAFSATYIAADMPWTGGVVFLRFTDNGTNRICQFSADGQNFMTFHSVGRTDYMTADQVGFFVNAVNATFGCGMTLLHWKES